MAFGWSSVGRLERHAAKVGAYSSGPTEALGRSRDHFICDAIDRPWINSFSSDLGRNRFHCGGMGRTQSVTFNRGGSIVETLSRLYLNLVHALFLASLTLALVSCERAGDVWKTSAACGDLTGVTGRASKISDGDTFRLAQSNGGSLTVRLDQIDAPETSQPWAKRSRQKLAELLGNGEVCVVGGKYDKYGRLIGEVRANGVQVNRVMVESGSAWAYRQYLRDKSLIELEAQARSEKRGLWSMPPQQTIPPWEFRHPELASKAEVVGAQGLLELPEHGHLAPECSAKPSCRQMSRCEEAKGWLAKCGGQGIDGDGDGVPCEKLCTSVD